MMFWSGLCSPPLLHPCIRFIALSLRVTMSTSCSWSLVLASPVGVRPRLLPTRAASPGRAHALARVVDWERSHPYSVVPATHCCVLAAYNTIYNLQSWLRHPGDEQSWITRLRHSGLGTLATSNPGLQGLGILA